MLLEIGLFCIFLYLVYVYLSSVPDGFPPGEWGWPLIGLIPSDKIPLDDYINKFRNKYGKTFTWRIGTRPVVFMTDYRTIKKAFVGSDVTERPPALSLDLYAEFGKYGISNGNSVEWQNVRRFSVRHLRDLGMGKSSLEDAIILEVENIVEDFKKHTNKAQAIPYSLNVAVVNIIWQIIANVRYDLDNEKVLNLERILTGIFNDAQSKGVLFYDFFHHFNRWVPNVIKRNLGLQDEFTRAIQYREFLQEVIDEHKSNLDPENPKDFIDEFLCEIKKVEEGKSSDTTQTLSEKELLYTLSDLFGAGSETVGSTIRWTLILMAEYPEIQKKVQLEIDSVLAKGQMPCLNDRSSLPFTDATINEVMRFKAVVPFSLYHYTNTDTIIDSYKIPKDTMVMSCAGFSHFDPDYWEEPEKFNPERFIEADGTVNSRKEGFLGFSVGRRVCPGESISRMELFLFLVTLLQRFNYEKADDDKNASGQTMFILPTDKKVIITTRDGYQ